MEKKELEKQVAKVVADLFNEKEEAEIRRKTEAELQRTATAISDLTSALETKNTEVADSAAKLSEGEASIQELTSELEAAKIELETANEKLGKTEKALEDIKKDRAAELRMAELEDAGVARSDRDSQTEKVREMKEEDFASYKDELVSIREAVVAELEKAKTEADAKAEEEAANSAAKKEADEKKAALEAAAGAGADADADADTGDAGDSEDASDKDDDLTVPAEIPLGQAAMASLNLETVPSDAINAKYAELGQALAEKYKKSE